LERVVIELPRELLSDRSGRAERLESWKIIQIFRVDHDDYAGICKIKMRSPDGDLKGLRGLFGITKIQSLSREKDRSYIAYVEGKPMKEWVRMSSPKEGYQSPPFELTSTTWKKTLLGTKEQIRRTLVKMEKAGLRFRIVSAGRARFTPGSLLSSLTVNQRATLTTAYERGYYDFPRRIGSESLARTLNLSKSTVSEHLRKAEKGLLDQVFIE
jgi:HTH DNA binding domain